MEIMIPDTCLVKIPRRLKTYYLILLSELLEIIGLASPCRLYCSKDGPIVAGGSIKGVKIGTVNPEKNSVAIYVKSPDGDSAAQFILPCPSGRDIDELLSSLTVATTTVNARFLARGNGNGGDHPVAASPKKDEPRASPGDGCDGAIAFLQKMADGFAKEWFALSTEIEALERLVEFCDFRMGSLQSHADLALVRLLEVEKRIAAKGRGHAEAKDLRKRGRELLNELTTVQEEKKAAQVQLGLKADEIDPLTPRHEALEKAVRTLRSAQPIPPPKCFPKFREVLRDLRGLLDHDEMSNLKKLLNIE